MGLVAVEHHCNQGHVIFFCTGNKGIAGNGGIAGFSGKGTRIVDRGIFHQHAVMVCHIAAFRIAFSRRQFVVAGAINF